MPRGMLEGSTALYKEPVVIGGRSPELLLGIGRLRNRGAMAPMERLKVTYVSPESLEPRARNPRTHTKKQVRQIAESIERFGFNNPVLVDRAGGIVAGHGRVAAAKRLGLQQVPTICLEDLTEDESAHM